jgi:hypothetical protein
MSFGGDYGQVKDTGSFVSAVKNAVAAMVVAIPEITIKDEENEFDARVGSEEYKKIHKDVVEYTTPITKALNELPVYYRYHIQKGLALGKGLKIVRYQNFTKSHNQTQKRKENTRKEIKKEEDVEDELANQFNDTMNISTKRRRVDDV